MCNWLFLSPQCPPLSISGQRGCSTHWTPNSVYVQLVVSVPPNVPLSLYQARRGAVHIGHSLYSCNWLFLSPQCPPLSISGHKGCITHWTPSVYLQLVVSAPPPPPPMSPLSLYQARKGALHIGHPLHMCNWLFLSPQCPPLSISGQKGCSTHWTPSAYVQLVVSVPPNVPPLSISGQKGCSTHWTPSAYVQLVVSVPPMSPSLYIRPERVHYTLDTICISATGCFCPPPPPPPPPPPNVPPLSISGQKGCIIQICHASVGIMMECLPEGRWFSPRAEPEGKPSSRGETFHQDTHTGMVYLIYYTEQTPFW